MSLSWLYPDASREEKPTRSSTMDSQPPHISRIDPVIEALLIALLAFMPAAFGVVDPWSEVIALAAGAGIALCLAIRALLLGGRMIRRPSVAWAAVALFIAVAVAQLLPLPMSLVRAISPETARLKTELLQDLPDAQEVLSHETLSFYPLGTRKELRTVLLATTVFAAVIAVYRDPRRIRRLLAAVTIIGAAVALLAIAQDLTGTRRIYWRFWQDEPARSGPFANHSHYGQFMNLSVGCALALLLARLTEAHRISFLSLAARTWWLAAVIVLGLVTIALSLTRGGMLSMIVSGAAATIVLIASRNLRQMAGVVVLLALGAIIFLLTIGYERVYARMLQPALGTRLQMIRDTGEMIRAFPSVGTGLGAYEWVFPAFDRSFVPSTAAYVENEYVQALVDTGPLGLAAVLFFVGAIAARYIRAIRNPDDERIGLAAVGLGYGLLAVMVHSLSDFGQHLPAVASLSAVTCGLLFNLGERRGGRTIAVRRGFGVMVTLLVLAGGSWALVGATRAWRAERHWNRAERLADALESQDWAGTDEDYVRLLSAAGEAIAAEPGHVNYRYWSAVYRWRWISTQADEESGIVPTTPQTVAAAERIVHELNDARALCPTYGLVYTMLGQVELKFLLRPIGYNHLETGWRLSRNDAEASFAAGQADALREEFDAATQKFQEALRIDPLVGERVIHFYLYHLKRPELAADAIGPRYFVLIDLRNELRKREEWKDLAREAEAKAFAVLAAECRLPDAPAWKFAMVGAYLTEQHRYAEAIKYIARALQFEPANMHWRVRYAELLHELGRTGEALEEVRRTLQMHPDSREAKQLLSRITAMPP